MAPLLSMDLDEKLASFKNEKLNPRTISLTTKNNSWENKHACGIFSMLTHACQNGVQQRSVWHPAVLNLKKIVFFNIISRTLGKLSNFSETQIIYVKITDIIITSDGFRKFFKIEILS